MAAITSAVIAAGALMYSVHEGQKQQELQKTAMRKQERAQREATSKALAAEREQRMASEKAKSRKPNISQLQSAEQQRSLSGPTSTMLTGPSGVSNRTTSLLGE